MNVRGPLRLASPALAFVALVACAVPAKETQDCQLDQAQPAFGFSEGDPCWVKTVQYARERKWGSRGALGALDTGWRLLNAGRHSDAMQAFNLAWLKFPDQGGPYHGFAVVVYERDRDSAKADALFRRAVSDPAVDPGAYADYAFFLLKLGRDAEAGTVLNNGLARHPTFPPLLFNRALLHVKHGKIDAACTDAKAAADAKHESAQRLVKDVCLSRG